MKYLILIIIVLSSCVDTNKRTDVGVILTYQTGEKDTVDFTVHSIDLGYIGLNDKGCLYAGSYYSVKVCGVRTIDSIIKYRTYIK